MKQQEPKQPLISASIVVCQAIEQRQCLTAAWDR